VKLPWPDGATAMAARGYVARLRGSVTFFSLQRPRRRRRPPLLAASVVRDKPALRLDRSPHPRRRLAQSLSGSRGIDPESPGPCSCQCPVARVRVSGPLTPGSLRVLVAAIV
jgi:hypothetical protein